MGFFTLEDFIAGWIGGICGLVTGHPLDTVKVRQQTYGGNLFTAIRRTFKHEGFRGFYKGLFFPLITIGPSNAILFGVYGNVLNLLKRTEKRDHSISYEDHIEMQRVFIAGAVGGFFQVLFTSPVELVKTILQARTEGKGSWKKHYEVSYTGSFQAFRGVLREHGIKGLYRGCIPMMIRDVPTSGLYTLTYELLMYSNFAQCATPVLVKEMVAGGTAGIISWVFVVPVDVVKSRIQADNPDKPVYQGMFDCMYKSYKEGGLKLFFRGLPALTVRAFIVNGAIFIGYETVLATNPLNI